MSHNIKNNLNITQINSIINFQKRYRFLKGELETINTQLTFYQDVLMSMLSNLIYANKMNLFCGSNTSFINILSELKQIKDNLNNLPNKVEMKDLKKISFNQISLILYQVYQQLLKYSNHVSFENFNYILELFGGKNWIRYFDKDEIDKILFISRFFKPLSVWDSELHGNGVPYPKVDEPKKKNAVMAKDLIEQLLGNNSGKVSSIIIGDSNMPAFLKSINEIVQTDKKERKRQNNWEKTECMQVMDEENVKITKNPKSASLYEDKFGACIFLRFLGNNTKYLVIQGIFKDDILNISRSISLANKKFLDHEEMFSKKVLQIDNTFKRRFLNILNLRDIIACSSQELCEDLKRKHNDYKNIQKKPFMGLINEFLLASKYRKVDILTLLLMSNEDDQKLAYILYDILKIKDKQNIANEIYDSLHYSIRELLNKSEKIVEEDEERLDKLASSDIPYEKRISMLKADDEVKTKAMEKLKSMKNNFQGDNKAQAWLDGLLKIPFGTFSENDIVSFKGRFTEKLNAIYPNAKLDTENEISQFLTNNPVSDELCKEWFDYIVERKDYLKKVRKTLDYAVYGHKEAKTQLERIFAQWINGESKGAILGLQGPPGTGKTSLAKNGLSKCLKDKNGKYRPFSFLPIGGSVNGSTLIGHNYTYVGASWGKICDILINTECMNPIIFIDEIDKVSATEHGREIISVLTHLTDSTQNDEFEDKYFSGVKLDLSKALIVFSFNDINLIDPILRDRITTIDTHPLSIDEKTTVIKDYMLPEVLKDVGFNKEEIIISDEMIKYLIETYTNEAGVRKIKEKIVDIIRDINLNRFHQPEKYPIPFTVTQSYVKLLFENHPRVRIKKIADISKVGCVNGLYATTSGIGGITIIQIMKYPSDKMLELSLTGKQGDVMKESVDYASKIAYSLLPEEKQSQLIQDGQNKKAFGLHVHTPEAAVPKDGPSAGAAMTLAVYSVLMNKKVNNNVALTGEIDLHRKVTAIGGVQAKLLGAKKAGVVKALIPKENEDDLEKMRRDGTTPEDENFEVVLIEDIHQVLYHALN